jgi:hypothetical protein
VFGAVRLVAIKSDLVIAFFDIAARCATLSGRVQLVCQNKVLVMLVYWYQLNEN